GEHVAPSPLDATGLAALTRQEIPASRRTLTELRRSELVETQDGGFVLTDAGNRAAQELVRRHRVYESYLGELGYPADHLHEAAARAEHYLAPLLEDALDSAVGKPQTDTHAQRMPVYW